MSDLGAALDDLLPPLPPLGARGRGAMARSAAGWSSPGCRTASPADGRCGGSRSVPAARPSRHRARRHDGHRGAASDGRGGAGGLGCGGGAAAADAAHRGRDVGSRGRAVARAAAVAAGAGCGAGAGESSLTGSADACAVIGLAAQDDSRSPPRLVLTNRCSGSNSSAVSPNATTVAPASTSTSVRRGELRRLAERVPHQIHLVGDRVQPARAGAAAAACPAGRVERAAHEQQRKQHHVDHAGEVLHRSEPRGHQQSQQRARRRPRAPARRPPRRRCPARPRTTSGAQASTIPPWSTPTSAAASARPASTAGHAGRAREHQPQHAELAVVHRRDRGEHRPEERRHDHDSRETRTPGTAARPRAGRWRCSRCRPAAAT